MFSTFSSKSIMDEEETLNINDNVIHKSNATSAINIYPTAKTKKSSKLRKAFERRFYIITWLRCYDRNAAVADLIAGITLGLTMIPQSIAYASLAGLPSQYGLYAAFMGSLIYVFVGTVKEVSIGPTSLMALLTIQYTYDKPVEFVIILGFLSGCVELLMGLFKLGFIVDFISVPITSAFTSATSMIIIGSQLKSLLGISYAAKDFYHSIVKLILKIADTTLGDSILGLCCIIFLLTLRKIKDIKLNRKTVCGKLISKMLWYLSISRNALVVLISSTIAFYWMSTTEKTIFHLSGTVVPGIPEFGLPAFEIEHRNQTLNFWEVCGELGTGIILVPLVAVLANVAIAKSFASGVMVDASQEMIALGLCNIFGSFVKSMPTCGAFTRSAVSHASGVRTPMSGIYAGGMTLLALTWLTPYFYYIPKSTLAAVLICAVAFMVDFTLPLRLWKTSKRDFVAWFACFSVCMVFGVEVGLLFGICVNFLHLLFIWARPNIVVKLEEIDNMEYISVTPNLGLYYPGIDHLRQKIGKAMLASNFQVPVVIFCGKISGLDYTSARGITNVAVDLSKNEQKLILFNLEQPLQSFIITGETEILFCSSMETLKEILTQANLRSGKIPLMPYIRNSIDLGYKIEPDINLEDDREN